MLPFVEISGKSIGESHPSYFIADIAANHDGSLDRAKKLIELAKEAGANAVKFQHHDCSKYVSDKGFKGLGGKFSHQAKWKKSIYEVYKDAEVPISWTEILKRVADSIEIDFFSTPYDLDMVDHLDPYVSCYKVGSGDICWDQMLEKVASKKKPVIFASGAASIGEVQHAVNTIKKINSQIVLMQCNTNYTGSIENLKFINLNVLKTYRVMFPDLVLGLSDHTPGHLTVLGSVALGGRVIEKHFTDDTRRDGPDHLFSMDPKAWREMVDQTRAMELALGVCVKNVQDNERETIVLQRRCARVVKDLKVGDVIRSADIVMQRPAPEGSFAPNRASELVGRTIGQAILAGEHFGNEHINWSVAPQNN